MNRILRMWTYTMAPVGLLGAIWLSPALSRADEPQPVEITTPFGIEMIRLPAGKFLMGDGDGEVDEQPVREVFVHSFDIDKYEVSQREYERLMGVNPSRWKGKDNPVEQVRWSDAVRYCNVRSEEEALTACYNPETWECDFSANGYRLPTEAEWEYACRAGTKSNRFFGAKAAKLKNYGWFKDNAGNRPRPVGRKLPNPWGLHDIYGNVWEWCHDLYQADYYHTRPGDNPHGPESAKTRVIRGGSWDSAAEKCRSAFRYHEIPGYVDICFGYDIYGFRVVRSAESSREAASE